MPESQKSSKTLNILLWIAQAIIALTFLWAGFMKIINPEELPFPWVKDNSTLVLFTGIIDLLAGVGIILPTLLRTKPQLPIYAAYGIIALMIAAIIFHISRGEAKDIGFNVFMVLLAVFVAWGRKTSVSV
jgi:uncharacterized membrane protein YphA (DoxX/SURF4 family)